MVVPGDIYDRSIPSSDAVTVCNRGFEAIRAAGAVIVATSGNHDSAVRLGAGASFAAAGGLHLITRVGQIGTPVMLSDQFGPVAFYGIPYLEPEITRVELDVPRARTHSDILGAAMSRVRRDLAERTAADPATRSVLLAHAFVVGGEASESERSISVGGVETVAVGEFDGVDYVALGHLHSPQMLSESVRYSGSPLPYSFGERSHRKAALLIELDAAGLSSVQRLDLPVIRGLSQVTGTLEELLTESKYADSEQLLRLRFAHRPGSSRRCHEAAPGTFSPLPFTSNGKGRKDNRISSIATRYGVEPTWRSPAALSRPCVVTRPSGRSR